jgi:hypothetical protein
VIIGYFVRGDGFSGNAAFSSASLSVDESAPEMDRIGFREGKTDAA